MGFDTFTKVCGQIAGNNASDGKSAKKYYYFMRVMGQDPSHTALEVALQTKPNFVILSEEVTARGMSLTDIVNEIADVVVARADAGKNFGTILVPDGLVCAIPELRIVVDEIDRVYRSSSEGIGIKRAADGRGLIAGRRSAEKERVLNELAVWIRALLCTLPEFFIDSLLLERSSDGGVQKSLCETERLLAHLVDSELAVRKRRGTFKGTFTPMCSYLGE